MGTATEALYGRILALVAPHQLRQSCNGVLGEEIAGVKHAMEDVMAAFARLQEVREAVAQLEQDKGTVPCRSDSLMTTVCEVSELQRQLGEVLPKLALGMAVYGKDTSSTVDKKRKRSAQKVDESVGKKAKVKARERKSKPKKSSRGEVETTQASSKPSSSSFSPSFPSSDKSSTESEFEDEKPPIEKPPRRSKQQPSKVHDGSGDELKLAHECLRLTHIIQTHKKLISLETHSEWKQLIQSIVRLIQQLANHSDTKHQKPAAEVTAQALEGVVKTLGELRWTPEYVNETQTLVMALSGACAKHKMLRAEFHRPRAQLESIAMGIPSDMANMPKRPRSAAPSQGETPGRSAGSPKAIGSSIEKAKIDMSNLVHKVDSLSFAERTHRIPEVLRMLQTTAAKDTNGRRYSSMIAGMKVVGKWIRESPCREHLLEKYRRLIVLLRAYAKCIPNEGNRLGFLRLMDGLDAVLKEREQASSVGEASGGIAKPSGERQTRSTGRSDAAFSSEALGVEDQALQQDIYDTLALVRKWKDGIFSLVQFDKALEVVGQVVYSTRTSERRLQNSLEVRECVIKLNRCADKIHTKQHRFKRQEAVQELLAKLKEQTGEAATRKPAKHHRLE